MFSIDAKILINNILGLPLQYCKGKSKILLSVCTHWQATISPALIQNNSCSLRLLLHVIFQHNDIIQTPIQFQSRPSVTTVQLSASCRFFFTMKRTTFVLILTSIYLLQVFMQNQIPLLISPGSKNGGFQTQQHIEIVPIRLSGSLP